MAILGIILVAGLLLAAAGLFIGGERGFGSLALVIGLAVLALSSLTHVGSNEVGIVNNFGSYQGTVGPGVHWVAPWSSTEKFSTRVQPLDVKNAHVTLKPETDGTVGATADVDITARWHIDGTAHAAELWKKYREFDTVRDKLVVSELKSSAREVLGSRQPAEAKAGNNIRPMGSELKDNLQSALRDDGIVIDSVSITDVDLDNDVENRLKAVVGADADLQKSKVDLEAAKVDAQADAARAKTATRETLLAQCLGNQRYAIEANAKAKKNVTPVPDCNFFKQNDLIPAR